MIDVVNASILLKNIKDLLKLYLRKSICKKFLDVL
jgi:hypothetical protein